MSQHESTPVYITKEDGNRWIIIQTPDDRTLCYCDTREKAETIVFAVNECDAKQKALIVYQADNIRLRNLNEELLAAAKKLRSDHSIAEPHHEHLCDICIEADKAIAKAEVRS